MSSTRFTVNLDEITFVLFDQLEMHKKLAGLERYADFDREIYEATLQGGKKISEDVLAPINRPGDQAGCTIDADGNVTTPEGYKDAWVQLAEGGWIGVSAPAEFGGGGMPFVMSMALYEGFIGASVAFMMYPGLAVAAARVIAKHGPEDKRAAWATKMFTGEWGGTMCLTEAGAGSSVGDNRAKATPTDEPGVYLIEGEKVFISAGDHDMVENIVHLVLARTPNAGKGTKGLSLFMVPKLLVDDEGELLGEEGARESNNARALRIEHKMGINGSATCVMGFGATGPCKGWMIGVENQGIELMFLMMNEARIGVAAQGMAIGAAAYNYSVHYANERTQGSSIREVRNPDAPRVAIVNHPDVRRMLMTQKVFADTMRSLCCKVALMSDLADELEDEEERARLSGRVDLLTPILKSMCTDIGYEMATLAVQVYGGYGYIQEYPVEQLVRDSKIFSIYEGTNGIQALD
ncbi:MAG: acyl-CoA dehydrogenase family protein, partial [Myxococcales bacterium]|nr:acyl-CoA dehydrogenase family protein [Myxococcales bacterium]